MLLRASKPKFDILVRKIAEKVKEEREMRRTIGVAIGSMQVRDMRERKNSVIHKIKRRDA